MVIWSLYFFLGWSGGDQEVKKMQHRVNKRSIRRDETGELCQFSSNILIRYLGSCLFRARVGGGELCTIADGQSHSFKVIFFSL